MRITTPTIAAAALAISTLAAQALPSAEPGNDCAFARTCDADAPGNALGQTAGTNRQGLHHLAQSGAAGKSARCEWDNGMVDTPEVYTCQFVPLNGDGSFSVIRSDGYELMLEVERPGVGNIQEYGDGRALINYGSFRRSSSDPACWESQSGEERLCAR